jgi:hypothetical protein
MRNSSNDKSERLYFCVSRHSRFVRTEEGRECSEGTVTRKTSRWQNEMRDGMSDSAPRGAETD